jgi:ERCC4-type nuclease|tara:strand:- start:33512 stop:34219 length:708 start_codon:yes stop_codon:yes gene_type:complete
MTKVLFIDNRERSGLEDLVKKYIDKKDGLHHKTKQNMIADYAFNSVGIEAKSIHDYMGSMMSGHLEQQLNNLDDNYNNAILLVWGTLDQYLTQVMKSGRKIRYQQAWSSYVGSLARYCTDYDIQIITLPDRSSAARFICKRFEKDGTLGSSSTYRVLRKTTSEDMRVDTLRAAGASEAIAHKLLEKFGSVAEISSVSVKELTEIVGLGKIRATRISEVLNSETKMASERVRMARS